MCNISVGPSDQLLFDETAADVRHFISAVQEKAWTPHKPIVLFYSLQHAFNFGATFGMVFRFRSDQKYSMRRGRVEGTTIFDSYLAIIIVASSILIVPPLLHFFKIITLSIVALSPESSNTPTIRDTVTGFQRSCGIPGNIYQT